MKRFTIDFLGKSYNAVEINGKCVSDDCITLDTIILAENELSDTLTQCFEKGDKHTDEYAYAMDIDEEIFGFAPKDIILNGSEEMLENYAKGLL